MHYFDSLNGMTWGQRIRSKKFWILVAIGSGLVSLFFGFMVSLPNSRTGPRPFIKPSERKIFPISPQQLIELYNTRLLAQTDNQESLRLLMLPAAEKMNKDPLNGDDYLLIKEVKKSTGQLLGRILLYVSGSSGNVMRFFFEWPAGSAQIFPGGGAGPVYPTIVGTILPTKTLQEDLLLINLCEQAITLNKELEQRIGGVRLFCIKGGGSLWHAGIMP